MPLYGDRVTTASLATRLVVDAVGVRVGVDLAALAPGDPARIAHAWAGARATEGATADITVAPVVGDRDGQTLSDLSTAVTLAAIGRRRGRLWMLHAAGLAAPDGGVVVLVGRSGAGKTTVTRALATAWGYVSDETVGIEDDGRVHPYRKPLSVITEGHGFKVQHSPADLGLLPLPETPLRARRFILLDRDLAHRHPRLVPVPLADALVALAPQSSALASMPHPLRTITHLIARTGGVLRAEYAEAEDLGPLIAEVMREETPTVGAPTATPPAALPTRPAPPAVADAARRYTRGAVVDRCDVPGDQLAVLTADVDGQGTLRVLGGAASALWFAADGATREELLRAVTDDDGAADAADALDGILDELVDAGLLSVSG